MTIAAVFKCETEALSTIEDLEIAGVDRAQIGIVTTDEHGSAARGDQTAPVSDIPYEPASAGAAAGAWIGGLGYLGAASAAGVVILSGGGLGVALAALAAAGTAGGLAGALVASGFHHQHAEFVNAEIEAGGLAIWIEPRSPDQATTVKGILQRHAAVQIVDDVERSSLDHQEDLIDESLEESFPASDPSSPKHVS